MTVSRTLFDRQGNWQQKDSADPLEGWRAQEVFNSGAQFGVPKNDVYGALYHHVLSTLKKLCKRLATMDFDFHMLAYDAADLPSFFGTLHPQHRFFDRIEVSNIVDVCYLGLERTLKALGPWLKPATVNPHATLLALFLNAASESARPSDLAQVLRDRTCPAYKFLELDSLDTLCSPASTKIACALELYRDFDAIFQRYMNAVKFRKCGRAAGLVMREKQSIIAPWPLRLDAHARDDEAKQRFEEVLAWGYGGGERYVEWVRARPGSAA